MSRKVLPILIAIALMGMSMLAFIVQPGKASDIGEVKFRGHVTTDEEWGEFVCYGSYYCNVTVEEILYDPNSTLSLEDVVAVCYNQSMSLKVGDWVECFGFYWKNVGPLQSLGRVCCKNGNYYVIPEFPSLIVMLLFMITTPLVLIVYRRKRFTFS